MDASSARQHNAPHAVNDGSEIRCPGWLAPRDWLRAQQSVPIACVDVLPFRGDGSEQFEVGLIQRNTPQDGRKWCLIGGRLGRDESFKEAIVRQLTTTLGMHVRFGVAADPMPIYVAQYFSTQRNVGSHDPRQHAIGMIFSVGIRGETVAQGEAFDFGWFKPTQLPREAEFGFGQAGILSACLTRLDEHTAESA